MARDPEKEHQLVLRLPSDYAARVHEALKTDALDEMLQVEFVRDPLGEMRQANVKFDDEVLTGKLVDLPCIIESYKTLDRKTLYKTGDISQMLVCAREPEELDLPTERVNVEEMTAAKRKEMYKKFIWNHGITLPMKNVRKRRFRKTKIKKIIESPEVEKEVKRLLRADTFAVSVSFKVVTDEDKQNDDTQSNKHFEQLLVKLSAMEACHYSPLYNCVISDAASRSQTPGMFQDEDSLLSTPANYSSGGGVDDKTALLRMLEEASCSSSSEDSEDEEINVEESLESEEVTMLRMAVQDLDTQIEEQRLKIQNTPNQMLRVRFESFLEELVKQRKSKLEELRRCQR